MAMGKYRVSQQRLDRAHGQQWRHRPGDHQRRRAGGSAQGHGRQEGRPGGALHDSLTQLVMDYVAAEGFGIVDWRALEIPDNLDVGRHDPAKLPGIVAGMNYADADVIVLSACLNALAAGRGPGRGPDRQARADRLHRHHLCHPQGTGAGPRGAGRGRAAVGRLSYDTGTSAAKALRNTRMTSSPNSPTPSTFRYGGNVRQRDPPALPALRRRRGDRARATRHPDPRHHQPGRDLGLRGRAPGPPVRPYVLDVRGRACRPPTRAWTTASMPRPPTGRLPGPGPAGLGAGRPLHGPGRIAVRAARSQPGGLTRLVIVDPPVSGPAAAPTRPPCPARDPADRHQDPAGRGAARGAVPPGAPEGDRARVRGRIQADRGGRADAHHLGRRRPALPPGQFPRPSAAGFVDQPGRWDHWPNGFVLTWPDEGESNGRVVLDRGDILLPMKDYVTEPIDSSSKRATSAHQRRPAGRHPQGVHGLLRGPRGLRRLPHRLGAAAALHWSCWPTTTRKPTSAWTPAPSRQTSCGPWAPTTRPGAAASRPAHRHPHAPLLGGAGPKPRSSTAWCRTRKDWRAPPRSKQGKDIA
ncbi:Transportin-1 [Manis javanica]|nr:Transportin-1 [Manis javanica]